jgi:hypothetical protein
MTPKRCSPLAPNGRNPCAVVMRKWPPASEEEQLKQQNSVYGVLNPLLVINEH